VARCAAGQVICLSAGALAAVVAAEAFTLAWTHSIEKTRWEEDWRVAAGQLHPVEARIRGSGAGMEPPAGAVLRDGVWHYRPVLPPQAGLRLAHSPYAAAYTLCIAGGCRPLAEHLPGIDNSAVIELRACP
jgi:hypothetical protein